MTTFLRILKHYLPGVDVAYGAYSFPNHRNDYINRDFIKYGFYNTLFYFLRMYPLLIK